MSKLSPIPDTVPIEDIIPPGSLETIGIVTAVPVLQVKWHDERTGCNLAHRYDAGQIAGTPAEYQGCHFYRSGGCQMNGNSYRDACLFHEPENGPAWTNLRRWALLEEPDGNTVITLRAHAVEIAADIGAVIVGAVRVTP